MYKIYINEVAVYLISTDQIGELKDLAADKTLTVAYIAKRKELLHVVDMCEKNCKFDNVVIHHLDGQVLIEAFESLFIVQVAAGGLIKNEENQFLFIFRRGSWDLPKGKIEKDETIEQAAIREVEEETGIKNVNLGEQLIITLHTFRDRKDRRVIKKSYWFMMDAPNQILTPQTEEDIDMAKWLHMDIFLKECHPVYKNIIEVIGAHLQRG
jgi:8-oxo-dGTP pyrophosphatase MutT (NUDIX family)